MARRGIIRWKSGHSIDTLPRRGGRERGEGRGGMRRRCQRDGCQCVSKEEENFSRLNKDLYSVEMLALTHSLPILFILHSLTHELILF